MRAALALALIAGPALADPLPDVACPGHPRCLELSPDRQSVLVPGVHRQARIALPDLDSKGATIELAPGALDWWQNMRLIALTRTETTAYSGGGAMVQWLILLRPTPGKAFAVLSVPVAGSRTIRACFSEADRERRGDHCADLYDFAATLTPGPDGSLIWQSHATIFPPGAALDQDNSLLPVAPDAEPETIDRCTVTRQFRLDDSAAYAPDAHMPDCDDFTRL